MSEETLPGGNTDGAVRIGGVVHKRASPWTPTVHALLRHLEYAGVPRALGFLAPTYWLDLRLRLTAPLPSFT